MKSLLLIAALGSASFLSACAPMRGGAGAYKDAWTKPPFHGMFHPREATGWSLDRNSIRHNRKCSLYNPTPKWACGKRDGIACKKCGG